MITAQILVHLLFPHSSNNYKAKLLQNATMVIVTALMFTVQLVLYLLPKTAPSILGYASQISIDEVVVLTNTKRQETGLSPLTMNSNLAAAARAKGEHMLANDYWAHVAPDGTEPWKFFADVGYTYRYAGENLARDFTNASSAVEAWMASTTHRENMLSPKYSEIGIAVVEGDLNGVDTTIIVQLFGATTDVTLAQAPEVPVETLVPTTIPTAAPIAFINQETPVPTTPAPTLAPTGTPLPTEASFVAAGQAVQQEIEPQVLISPFNTTRGVSLGILGGLIALMFVDFAVMRHRRLSRIGGRVYAHLSFLAIIFIVAMIIRSGKII